ncbi:unnamed protein product [marine sediment metagenome]|uniref:Uncharacterized protein n=1 Tax=marine sediment metagenome TaxID=412755 RepID=X0Z2V7_9ZZZZ
MNRVENYIHIFNKDFLEDFMTHVGLTISETGIYRPGFAEEIHIKAIKRK